MERLKIMIAHRKARLALALCVLLAHQTARCDDGSAAADADLQQIVVSATRTEQPLDKTGSSMSVITAADLAQRQTLIVSDILAQTPGLTVSRNGGPGQLTSLYIRGAEPGESLVLIDGIRINDPSSPDGEPILGDLLNNNIDRIEILRGPQSTLYGSDAIGGVVNILTQRGSTAPLSLRVQAEGGTFDTQSFNAAADGTDGPLQYGTAINYYDTRGISAADARSGNTEPDGYVNFGATANARLQANDLLSLDLRGFYLRSRTGIDGYPPPDYTLRDDPEFGENYLRAGYAGLNLALFDHAFTQRLAVIASDSDRRFFGSFDPVSYAFSPTENFYASGGATRIEYQGIIELGKTNEITYGAERQLSTLSTDTLPDYGTGPTVGRDRITGYYAEWQSTLAQQLTLTGGVRYDDDAQFGGHTTLKVAAAWQLFQGNTVLRANYGGGFKAPTLYQLYSEYSNPTQPLRAETADGWEVGADQLLLDKHLRASLTYFERHEQNAIDFFDCYDELTPVGACLLRAAVGGYYYNVDRSRSSGYEAALVARPAQVLNAWINYTNLKAIDELTGLALARRPHVSGNVGLDWMPEPRSSLGASLSYVGARFDDDADTTPLHSATTVNLYASYALGAHLQLFGRIENLFNDVAEPTFGYGALTRGCYAGLRATL
jgi:vitamin B12 transporter